MSSCVARRSGLRRPSATISSDVIEGDSTLRRARSNVWRQLGISHGAAQTTKVSAVALLDRVTETNLRNTFVTPERVNDFETPGFISLVSEWG